VNSPLANRSTQELLQVSWNSSQAAALMLICVKKRPLSAKMFLPTPPIRRYGITAFPVIIRKKQGRINEVRGGKNWIG